MPATRRSTNGSRGGASLLSHFQATKRPLSSSVSSSIKGKAKATETTNHASNETPPGPVDSSTGNDTSVERQAKNSSEGISAVSTSSSGASSESVALLEAEHKSPVSVRQDPDRKKLFLLISPGARKGRSNTHKVSDESLSSEADNAAPPLSITLPPFRAMRDGSPLADRTPVREVPSDYREPPQAPRKRRLSQLSYQAFLDRYDESPLPTDKKRPSYKAFGASQEGGLSLMHAESPEVLSRADKRPRRDDDDEDVSCKTPTRASHESSDDDDLVITPQAVRERPKGHPLVPFATPKKAATFNDPFQPARPKPTLSAGIFSYASTPKQRAPRPPVSNHPVATIGTEEDNPFINSESVSTPIRQRSEQPIPTLPYFLSPSLPLPRHYQTLLHLHTAIEHALVVHLATAGLGNSSVSRLPAHSESTLGHTSTASVIRLPNLITYGTLRPLVERTAGRKLGSTELARLLFIWTDGHTATAGTQDDSTAATTPIRGDCQIVEPPVGGLGFLIGRQRSLDSSGRKKWDWSLGIELTVSRAQRATTPPIQVSFGSSPASSPSKSAPRTPSLRDSDSIPSMQTPPSTPPSTRRHREISGGTEASPLTPSRTEGQVRREGMSFLAMWNNGVEERKAEVARRLRVLCASEMGKWLQDRLDDTSSSAQTQEVARPSTPERNTSGVDIGAGGLITPSSTRPEGRRRGGRFVHYDQDSLMVDTCEVSTTNSPLKAGESQAQSADALWARPTAGSILSRWHPQWSVEDCAPVPCALLPNLRDVEMKSRTNQRKLKLAQPSQAVAEPESTLSPATAAASESRAPLSLMDRIKAKEALQREALAQRHPCLNGSSSQEDVMSSFKRRSTLSRLNDVASNLYLLFTSSPLLTEARHGSRLPALPLPDVLTSIAKSSRVSLSVSEARGALDLLKEICPGFVDVQNVGGQEWARLGGGGASLADVRRRVKEELERSR